MNNISLLLTSENAPRNNRNTQAKNNANMCKVWRQVRNLILVPNYLNFIYFICFWFLPTNSDEINRCTVLTTRRTLTFCLMVVLPVAIAVSVLG